MVLMQSSFDSMNKEFTNTISTPHWLTLLRRNWRFLFALTILIIANLIVWADVLRGCNAVQTNQQTQQVFDTLEVKKTNR